MFPKANTLRKEHDSFNTSKMQEILLLISSMITEAHQRHETTVDLTSVLRKQNAWHMSGAIKKYLEDPERGFIVDDVGQYNEHYFSVRW